MQGVSLVPTARHHSSADGTASSGSCQLLLFLALSFLPVQACINIPTPAVTTAAGLPHSQAKTKQALRRQYAVAAMSSLDRKEGGGGRCFQW